MEGKKMDQETVDHIISFWRDINGDRLKKAFSDKDADLLGKRKDELPPILPN